MGNFEISLDFCLTSPAACATIRQKGGESMAHSKIQNLTRCALAAAVLAVCAWITVPGPIPFTLQTMGVFLTLELLGGNLGTQAICVYLGLGILGLPVFSGFRGGIGMLLGATGGYLSGFLVAAVLYGSLKKWGCPTLAAQGLGLLSCYGFGPAWYLLAFGQGSSLWAVLSTCVIPFLIPDGLKLALAHLLAKRLMPYIHA